MFWDVVKAKINRAQILYSFYTFKLFFLSCNNTAIYIAHYYFSLHTQFNQKFYMNP